MTNLLSWDAEAFNLSDFEVKSGATIDNTEFRSGTHSMKIASNGTQQDQGYQSLSGKAWAISLNGEYFYRWWMKCGDLTWSNQNKFKANRWTDQVTAVMTGFLLQTGVQPGEHNSGFTSDQGAGSGGEGPLISYSFDTTTHPVIKNWQEYIVDFKLQSVVDATDGWMKFYVNGSLVGQLTGVRWWSGSFPNMAEAKADFMMWNFPQNVSGNLWIDDVSVDTTFNSIYSPASSTPNPIIRSGGSGGTGIRYAGQRRGGR